jgi:hypothetical protein
LSLSKLIIILPLVALITSCSSVQAVQKKAESPNKFSGYYNQNPNIMLQQAILKADTKTVNTAIQRGADVNAFFDPFDHGLGTRYQSITPLFGLINGVHYVEYRSYNFDKYELKNIVRILLEAGARIDQPQSVPPNKDGKFGTGGSINFQVALPALMEYGHIPTKSELSRFGCSMRKKDKDENLMCPYTWVATEMNPGFDDHFKAKHPDLYNYIPAKIKKKHKEYTAIVNQRAEALRLKEQAIRAEEEALTEFVLRHSNNDEVTLGQKLCLFTERNQIYVGHADNVGSGNVKFITQSVFDYTSAGVNRNSKTNSADSLWVSEDKLSICPIGT